MAHEREGPSRRGVVDRRWLKRFDLEDDEEGGANREEEERETRGVGGRELGPIGSFSHFCLFLVWLNGGRL